MRFAGHETSSCRIERGEAQAPLDRALGFHYQPAFFLFCAVALLAGPSVFVDPHKSRGISTTHTTRKEQLDVFDRILFSVEVRDVFVLLCPGF